MTAFVASHALIAFLLGPFSLPAEAPVYESVRSRLLPFLSEFEGSVPHMYLDRTGRVATGIGTDINSPLAALAIVWRHRYDRTLATPNEVRAEWSRVHALQIYAADGGGEGSVFDRTAVLYVDPDSLAEYTDRLLANGEATLRTQRHLGQAYDTIPADAQLARLRTMYADGPGSMWPKMDAAIRAADFVTAAAESRPRDYDTQNHAYRQSYDAVRVLYMNAAIVTERGLDPTVLYWPRCLAEERSDTEPVPAS